MNLKKFEAKFKENRLTVNDIKKLLNYAIELQNEKPEDKSIEHKGQKLKINEIKWVDGDRYKDEYDHIWTVSQQELRRISERGNVEYITDGRFALGLLLRMDFEKVEEIDDSEIVQTVIE